VVGSLDPFRSIHSEVAQVVDHLVVSGKVPVFRLHPYFEARPILKFLLVGWIKRRWAGASIHSPRSVPLINSISESDFLLAFSSAAAYEFALLNKPSILLDKAALNRTRQEIGQGVGERVVFHSLDQLLQAQLIEATSRKHDFLGAKKLLEILEAR
jgi:hypothetical protein